jgi:DNA-binding MarR family transcriptional regulator
MLQVANDNWTLLGSHGVVLFYVAANPDATLKEMADSLLWSERRITAVVRDLASAGMIDVKKNGRRNSYSVNTEARFRHPTLSHVKLGTFVEALQKPDGEC